MLPCISYKIQERNAFKPIIIIHHLCGILFIRTKVKKFFQLLFYCGYIVIQNFCTQQITFFTFSRRISNHTCGATN